MKFKLDENFGTRTLQIFKNAGFEAKTVREQGLEGCTDQHLYDMCCLEKICLVTLDMDFSDVTRFSPLETSGLAVVRLPKNPSLVLLEKMIENFITIIKKIPVEKKLWIVEPHRIRIHQSNIDEELQ